MSRDEKRYYTMEYGTSLIRIDGSYGEGGGQILRTSLALSLVLSRPVEIFNIRKGRKKGGLQPQHLTCVNACRDIGNARVEGNVINSTWFRFYPEDVKGGKFLFNVAEIRGSAGSTSLVLQSVLLPLCFASLPSSLTIIGGTHVQWSPPFHYLRDIFLPAISAMNCSVKLSIEKWGWYPVGGGIIHGEVRPVTELKGINICDRGKLLGIKGISAVSNLPVSIAERQRSAGIHMLKPFSSRIDIETLSAPSPGKGTFFFIVAEYEGIRAGFSALGAPGKPAEKVAEEACKEFIEYNNANGAIDPHLADQLIPYIAISKKPSSFTTTRITKHLLTNIWTVRNFMDIDIRVEGEEGGEGIVYSNC